MDPALTTARLPIRAVPEADESVVGFIIRLAERNQLASPMWLAALVKIPFNKLDVAATKPFDPQHLTVASGVDESTLRRMAYWPCNDGRYVTFFGHRLRPDLVTLQHRRACPQCPAAAPYHRAAWDLSVVDVCPRHAVQLITHCPACHRQLDWNCASITSCRCGTDLRTARAEPLPIAELNGVRHVHRLLGLPLDTAEISTPISEPLADLEPNELLMLMLYLGWYATGARQRPRPIKLLTMGSAVHQYMNVGHQVCAGWPDSFASYLDMLRQGTRKSLNHKDLLKPVLAWALDRKASSALYSHLQGPVHSYLKQHPELQSQYGPLANNLISVQHAAVRLERSPDDVHAVLERHGLLSWDDAPCDRTPYCVEAGVISELRTEMETLVHRHAARRILGCPPVTADSVLDCGIIARASGVAAELFGRVAWRRSDIEALIEGLEQRATAGSLSLQYVPLPKPLRILMSRNQDITGVLHDALNGRLGPMTIDTSAVGLSRIHVDAAACGRLMSI